MGNRFNENAWSLKNYPQMTQMAADDAGKSSVQTVKHTLFSAAICVICGSSFFNHTAFNRGAESRGLGMNSHFNENACSLKNDPQMTQMAADEVGKSSVRTGKHTCLSAAICVICGSFFLGHAASTAGRSPEVGHGHPFQRKCLFTQELSADDADGRDEVGKSLAQTGKHTCLSAAICVICG